MFKIEQDKELAIVQSGITSKMVILVMPDIFLRKEICIMRRLRRVIAIILALCMALGLYHVDVRADESGEPQEYQQDETTDDASVTDADIAEPIVDEAAPEEDAMIIPDAAEIADEQALKNVPTEGPKGTLTFTNASDFNGDTVYFPAGTDEYYKLKVEYLPEGAEDYSTLYIDEDEHERPVIKDVPSGVTVRFTITYPDYVEYIPFLTIGEDLYVFEGNQFITETYFDDEIKDVDIDLAYPIDSVTVDDMSIYEGNYETRDIWEGEQITGQYQGYRTWPYSVHVKLIDGKEFNGEAGDVKRAIAEYFYTDEGPLNMWEDAEQPYENGVTKWTVGSYDASLNVMGTETDYKIIIEEHPIAEISVSDIVRYEGEYETRDIWEDGHVIGQYQGYKTWPEDVYVKLTDGTEFRGEGGDVKRALAAHFNVNEDEFDFYEDFDQPSENGVTKWGVGEHDVTLHILGKTSGYKVKVVKSPIAKLEVGNFSVMSGAYQDREAGRNNPETGQYERIQVKAYNTWPMYVKATLSEDYENEVIEGEPDEVRKSLAAKFGYSDPWSMNYGDDFDGSQDYDENNVTTWTEGEHTVKFFALGAETTYTVTVVDVPIATMTQPTITKYVGDYNDMRGFDYVDEHGDPQHDDRDWLGYDVSPRDLTVTFTDDSDPISGDCWYVRDEIQKKYNVRLDDRTDGNTQKPDENNITNWGPGTYDITFWLGASSVSYKVEIKDNPVKAVSVEDIDKLEGDTREERGYNDPETGEWIDNARFQIYDPWPKKMTVTLSDEYAELNGNNATITGEGNEVKDKLMQLLGIEDDRNLDFGWKTNQTPTNVWGVGEHPVEFSVVGVKAQYKVNVIKNPIDSVTVKDKMIVVGDTFEEHGWYSPEYSDPNVVWSRYDSWPTYVKVVVKGENDKEKVFEGDPNSFREELIQTIGYDVDYICDDQQKPVQDGDVNVSNWTAGNSYPCTFTIGGVIGKYNVAVIDSPIESIEVPGMDYQWLGDTYTERGYESDNGWVDEEWQKYGYWPEQIKVNFTEVASQTDPERYGEPVILTGDHDEMCATLAEVLGADPGDVRVETHDDQRPDANGISTWTAGEHTVDVSVAGKHADFKVKIVDLGIKSIEVEKVYRDYEDLCPIGYINEQGEWFDDESIPEEDRFHGYNFFPETVTITFNDDTVVETNDPFGYAEELRESLGVPENRHIHVFAYCDQVPDEAGETTWGIGHHTATLEFAAYKCEYDVVITGDRGNYTGLAEDVDTGDNYYYFEDGFMVENFNGFLKGAVASVIARYGHEEEQPTEFIENSDGWWLVVDGEVNITDGPIKAEGVINGKKAVYKVTNGKYDPKFTGFAEENGVSYYFVKGKFVETETVAQDPRDDKWYYVKDGKKDPTFTGICKATNKSWYFTRNGVWDDTFCGLAQATNGIWYYCTDGVIDRTFTGQIAPTVEGKLYYVNKGKPTKNFTEKVAYCPSDKTWYYCVNGRPKLTVSKKIAYRTDGEWCYITNGKFDKSFTGVAQATNGNWYYCKKGIMDKTFTGISKDVKGAYKYVANGKYNTKYKGLAKLSSGTTLYYVKNGTIDRTFNGTCKYNGVTYKVTKGVAKPQ